MSLPAVIDTSAAERRALKIGLRLDGIADGYEAVVPMIREAIELRDHETLGYRSPGDYLADRFGQALARLPQGARRDAVAAIDAVQPVSTRSLAPVFGVSNYTIHKDREANAGVSDLTPATDNPSDVETGGEVTPPAEALTTPAQPVADDAVEEQPGEAVEVHPLAPPARPVVGLDGKTYTKPSMPKPPRRRPLTDGFFTAVYDTRKKVESLHRLTQDDRFPQNAEKVAQAHLNDLIRTRDLLEQVITSLKKEVTA